MPENRLFFDMAQSMLTCLLGSYVLVNLIVLPMEVKLCCLKCFELFCPFRSSEQVLGGLTKCLEVARF